VITQGSVTQDSVDFDELEQLPPSNVEAMEEQVISSAEGTMTAHPISLLHEVEADQTSKITFHETATLPTSHLKDAPMHELQATKDAEPEVSLRSSQSVSPFLCPSTFLRWQHQGRKNPAHL